MVVIVIVINIVVIVVIVIVINMVVIVIVINMVVMVTLFQGRKTPVGRSSGDYRPLDRILPQAISTRIFGVSSNEIQNVGYIVAQSYLFWLMLRLLNSVISHSTQVEMPTGEKISYLLKHLLVPLLIQLVQANYECPATRTFYECSSQKARRSAKTFPHSSHKGQFRPIKIPSNLVSRHWQWRQQGPNCPISSLSLHPIHLSTPFPGNNSPADVFPVKATLLILSFLEYVNPTASLTATSKTK